MEEELVLCDTNVFIHFFNGNEETIAIFEKLDKKAPENSGTEDYSKE